MIGETPRPLLVRPLDSGPDTPALFFAPQRCDGKPQLSGGYNALNNNCAFCAGMRAAEVSRRPLSTRSRDLDPNRFGEFDPFATPHSYDRCLREAVTGVSRLLGFWS